ncbi:MAG: SPFH domain-containing protein [Defluviitaleaceae bacterium]|nr:SPFH domain-containing protein [Defluviitaleaceae bacterium]
MPNPITNLFNRVAADPTAGLADSQTAQRLSQNINLGNVADSLNSDNLAQRIKEKGFASVIEYEGGNDTFIWKHPLQDFTTGSQLIVHESQEAIFFMNGRALDLFGPGRHTLETQNLPLVGKFFKAATGGVTPFHCEVYFINKTEQMAIKWGTDSKLEYVEPTYGFPIQIGASGEMSLRVDDSRRLLVKIVGTENYITHQGFVQKMRAFLNTRIKNHLSAYIKRERINIFEIDEHLLTLSETLHGLFSPDFMDYGISMERFFVTTIVKPEEDGNYKRFKELHFRQYADLAEAKLRQQTGLIDQETQAQRMIIEAQGLAQKRALEGYTYQDERGFDVAERVAGNEGVGQMSNMGIGLGMMAGVGGALGRNVGDMVNNSMNAATGAAQAPAIGAYETLCPACNAKTPKGKFCVECGASFVRKCTGCNTELPPGGKFCLECGQKQEA